MAVRCELLCIWLLLYRQVYDAMQHKPTYNSSVLTLWCAGSYTHQTGAGTEWDGVTVEQWQAYALQQGWDLGYLQQQANYQQYGAWGTDAAGTAYAQVSSSKRSLIPRCFSLSWC
jgi:hypothetical protein